MQIRNKSKLKEKISVILVFDFFKPLRYWKGNSNWKREQNGHNAEHSTG